MKKYKILQRETKEDLKNERYIMSTARKIQYC